MHLIFLPIVLIKYNREETFVVHGDEVNGETIVNLGTLARSFKDLSGLDSRVANIIIERIREKAQETKTLIVPLFTLVSTIICISLIMI